MGLQTDAQNAIFEEISRQVPEVENLPNRASKARVIQDLALAYRYAAGGSQPGGTGVAK